MNKSKNPTNITSSGSPTRSSHAKGRRLRKGTNNISGDEKELQALQQAYNQMTMARRAQEIKTQETLRKQSQVIGSLKADRRSLQEELERVSHALGMKKLLSQCINSLHHSDLIDKSICQEKQTITGLQKEVNEMHRKIDKEKKAAAVDADPTRKVQRLTQQLAQVNKRISTILSNNAQLRQDIESMRREKVKFLQMHSKLEKALQETHLEGGRVLQQVSESVLIRENTKAQTLQVLEQTCTHAMKMQDLQIQKGHVDKSEHFQQQKNKARQPNSNYCSTAEKRGARKQELQVNQQEQLKEYEMAMEKINDIVQSWGRQRISERREKSSEDSPKDSNTVIEPSPSTSWESASLLPASKRRATVIGPMFQGAAAGFWGETKGVQLGRRLTEYRRRSTISQGLKAEEQEQLRQLSSTVLQQNPQKPAAGPDPDLLCNFYMEGEYSNFSLFSYVSEQSRQIEDMTRDVQELRMRMEEEQERESAEHHHLQDRVKQLQLRCQQATQTAETLQKEVEEKEGFLSLVRTVAESLASRAGVDISVFKPWIEESEPSAVLALLRQIHHKVNQLLAICSYTQHQEKKDDKRSITSISEILDSRTLPNIDIPTSEARFLPESGKEYGEEELKPLSREALQKTLLEML